MSLGNRDPRRELCDELARELSAPGALRQLRLLQLVGLLRGPGLAVPSARRTTAEEGSVTSARAISIWKPVSRSGELVWERPKPLPLGDHYATRRTLRRLPEKGRQRILFFGESAAAGYLYAPWHTPARLLESQLNAVAGDCGESGWEVIDLARTNERLDSMVATFAAALQLKAQVAVFFAGNNWPLLETPELSPYAPAVRWRQRYGLGLRSGGLVGPVELARLQLQRKVRGAMARIAQLAAGVGVDVVLVRPEVNLADWPARQPVAWLPYGRSASWYEFDSRARRALEEGDWVAARRWALEMAGLDGGLNPTAQRLLASAHLGASEVAAAVSACRREVDADSYPIAAFLPSPRATRQVGDLLRQAAEEHGFATVDLPSIFAAHSATSLAESLPGRRMFLDYCHLTAEGMAVAMAATACSILRVVKSAEVATWGEILALRDPTGTAISQPVPEVDAVAHLGAAIHTAHRLAGAPGKAELLRHWCRQALRSWPAISATMVDLARARCAPVPELLSAEQQEILASPAVLGFQHGWSWQAVDGELFTAMIAVLRQGDGGQCTAAKQIEAAILAHRAASPGRSIELAVPGFHLAEPVECLFPEAMAETRRSSRAMLRCVWPETAFDLPWDGELALRLRATLRLPPIAGLASRGAATVRLMLNEHSCGEVEVGARWSRQEIELPIHHLRRGLNRLRLVWPPLPGGGEAALEAAGERLECGVEADIHPLFGEIYSLKVAVVDQVLDLHGTAEERG